MVAVGELQDGQPPQVRRSACENRGLNELTGRELWQRNVRRSTVAMLGSNALAAVVVFLYLALVVPVPSVAHPGRVTLLNLVVFAVYLAVAFPIAWVWSLRRVRATGAWLMAGRPPTPAERDLSLRAPLHQLQILAAGWGVAVVLFFAVNVTISVGLAAELSVAIAFGGVITSVLGYLLIERINRSGTALALAIGPPRRPVGPGVAARLMLTWAIGTGVFLSAIAALAIVLLADPGRESLSRVLASVLFLSVGGLAIGLLTVTFAARAIADPLESIRSTLGEVERGRTDVEVPIDDRSEIGLLQAGVNRMVVGLREHERLRDLFGRHVGEDVARQALERGIELGGEIREAAVLFVDVVGSTGLAASRPPDEVVAMLNAFFAIVVTVVQGHGGWVNKFEGDAALCVFGAPLEIDDAAGAALAAGRQLRHRLIAQVPDLPAGVGISAGPILAGNIGAHDRFEYTVIGDAVNEAARLTELAKQHHERLLASEAVLTRAGAHEAAHWRLSGSVKLRGRSEPTRLAVA
jgi:adenylate cyclase